MIRKKILKKLLILKKIVVGFTASQLKKGKSFILLKDQILFTKPTKYSKPLFKVAKGRLLLVKKCKKNWCRVKTENFLGWVKTNEIWGLY